MSYLADRAYRRVLFYLTMVTFFVALVMYAFSGCELRKRAQKRACRAGDVAACLAVGKYYEDKPLGLVSFAMSYSDTSIAHYYQACKRKSATGCERMLHVLDKSEQAKNLSTDVTAIADALIAACSDRVDGVCDELWSFMSDRDWAQNRTAAAFDQRCAAGNGQACYLFGRMHGQGLGGQRNVAEEVIPLYDKACATGIADGCKYAHDYRAEQARRTAKNAPDATGAP
jgi:TPR repeat protein